MTINDNSLEKLFEKTGPLLTLEEASSILRYKSISAARKAHSRGTFPVKLYRFERRTGYYARLDEVIACLNNMKVS